MSVHICKCIHNGREEWHLRYPGMTEKEAQSVADRINAGALWSDVLPGRRLWLWRNGDHFLAFTHLYPCFSPGGDPMVLGEPFGVAIYKVSSPGPLDKP